MIDKYIIDRLKDLPIEKVAEDLGMTVIRHKARCPFHDDTRPSLTFNIRKNKYRCYVCDAKGGPIDLTMHVLNLNFVEACKWLGNLTNVEIPTLNTSPSTLDIRHSTLDIPYLERLMSQPVINEQASRFLYQERKISVDVVRQLGLSSIAYDCPMSSSPKPTYFDGPALLIPYRDIDGNLLSVQSRYLGNSSNSSNSCSKTIPRFRFPKGSRCSIFNLPVLKTCKPNEPVFITEGVTDCLAMLSAGFKSIAIPSATLLKPEDLSQLSTLSSKLSTTFHMFPDADEPGERLFNQLKELLETPSSLNPTPSTLVRHQLPAGFKDVGQYYSFIHKDDRP